MNDPAGIPHRTQPTDYTGPPPTGAYPPPPQYPGPPPWVLPYASGPPGGAYPPPPPGPRERPGGVLAAAILAVVAGGLLVIAAGLLFFGAAFLHALDQVDGTARDGYVAEFTVDALLDTVAAGLLLAGGIGLTSRSARARRLLVAGCALVLVLAGYWVVRWADRSSDAVVGYAGLFAIFAAAVLALVCSGSVSAWLPAAAAPRPDPPGRR